MQEKDGYCSMHWKPRHELNPSDSDSRYHGVAWQRLRKAFLRRNPLCDQCGRIATVPHHVLSIDEGGEFYDGDNLLALCRACHENVHGR
jgi:5-methylcytosine-specific restriction endonuclease McrA